MPESDPKLPTPSPSVVFKRLDEGGVLLSTKDEVYFGVNRVGARIWSLLPPAARTLEEMCATLAQEYSDVSIERIRQDARAFLAEIVAAGLATAPTEERSVDSTDSSSAAPEIR